MMDWERLGLVYKAQGRQGWNLHSALTPTPVVFADKIRVYAGFRDDQGVSRIGYVDLDKNDPSVVLKVSERPVLDIGRPGAFDDNGVILGDLIWVEDRLYMYYVGFQLPHKVKFLAFTGLAISDDSGETFTRYSTVPLLDRKEGAAHFNAVHSVMRQDGIFRYWLGAGSAWETINGRSYPSYNVKYTESADGIHFDKEAADCLRFSREKEYRIGRPKVYFSNGRYSMIFTWGDLNGNYRMGYATSRDGKAWERDDEALNFHPSAGGWDNKWVSYGALFSVNDKTYMVYNGNEMGKDGFGLALLKK